MKQKRFLQAAFGALALTALAAAGCGDSSDSLSYDSAAGTETKDSTTKTGEGSGAASGLKVFYKPQGGFWTEGYEEFLKTAINEDASVNLPSNCIQRGGMLLVGWYTYPTPEIEPEPEISSSNSESAPDGEYSDDYEEPKEQEIAPPEPASYLRKGDAIPNGNFTEGTIIKEDVTLYAWWQELDPDVKIVTFVPYNTENSPGFKRQAVPDAEGAYYVPQGSFPKVSGGPENYHAVPSDTTWFTAVSGGEPFTSSTQVTEDITVYGHWEGDEWDFTFDFNGGTNNGNETSHTEKFTYSKDKPNTVTLPETMTLQAPEGYVGFLGWFTDKRNNVNDSNVPASNDPKRFEPGLSPIDANHKTVYALWQNRPAGSKLVTFEPYPGHIYTTMLAQPDADGEYKVSGNLPPVEERTHYTTDGHWYYGNGAAPVEFTRNTIVTEDMTVYAKWEPKTYTVTFNWNNDDAHNPQAIPVEYNKTVQEAESSFPQIGDRPHYQSDNIWYVVSAGGDHALNSALGPDTPITGNITVSPIWNAKTYRLYFYKNEAAGESSYNMMLFTYPDVNVLENALPQITRQYWGFEGWYENTGGNGSKYTGGQLLADKNVYAKWNAGELEITAIDATYGTVKAKINQTVSGSTLNYTSSIPKFVFETSDVNVRVKISASFTYNGASLGTPLINAISGATSPLLTVANSDISNGTAQNSAEFIVTSPNPATPAKTYKITFSKDTTDKPMASGGNNTKVIRKSGTGDSSVWEEIHQFTAVTTSGKLTFYNGRRPSNLTAWVLAVGGGGGAGGGNYPSSGGGAGGMVENTDYALTADEYTVEVGSGGSGGTCAGPKETASDGTNGSNSKFGTGITAYGGGRGGTHNGNGNCSPGSSGGSSGGGGGSGAVTATKGTGGGTGTNGGNYGNAGGYGTNAGDYAGGGGGAGGAGEWINMQTANNNNNTGGAGKASSITGSSVTYAAGGKTAAPVAGASDETKKTGSNGGANTGNGGQGAWNANGGSGGSGIVVVRFKFSEQL
ncbi:MAG: InlB B-repeat-containing protein [Spirochaetaceae bacterium]|jgi:hypothetical protein|nr:InlB B-repeat-containing protein [Spirochaetaceae bacterium]